MTDRQTLISFMLTGALLILLVFYAFFLDENSRNDFLSEGGGIESVTALGYFLCAIFIAYKGRLAYLKSHHYFILIVLFFMLRELDFDKKFTTMSILKSAFFVSNEVPGIEKLVGAMVILLLLYTVVSIIYRHTNAFLSGLKNRSVISIGALIVLALLVICKSLDGLARRLGRFGVELGNQTSMYATTVEEILELGIPIVIFLTFSAYFKRVRN